MPLPRHGLTFPWLRLSRVSDKPYLEVEAWPNLEVSSAESGLGSNKIGNSTEHGIHPTSGRMGSTGILAGLGRAWRDLRTSEFARQLLTLLLERSSEELVGEGQAASTDVRAEAVTRSRTSTNIGRMWPDVGPIRANVARSMLDKHETRVDQNRSTSKQFQ